MTRPVGPGDCAPGDYAKWQRNVTHALPFCHVRLSGPKPQPKAYPKQLTKLGDHLRKMRLALGLLQKDVAEQLGVDAASICNWESNETQPMVHCLPGILAFLGHNLLPEPDDLIGKFKRLRSILGLNQEQLAERLGIDESTIAGWERGENAPVGAYRKLLQEFVTGDGLLPTGPATAPARSTTAFLARGNLVRSAARRALRLHSH